MPETLRELIDKRTLSSKHYLNDDGSITANIFSAPVHYKDKSTGTLEDIDLNITPEQNWEFEYAAKKNNFRAYFNDSTDINNSTLACFEIIDSQGVSRWINYKMFGASPTTSSYNGNAFRYENVLNNIDLEYVVTPTRLKENIVVKQAVDNFSFTFTLKMSEGLKLEQQNDGSIWFIDTETGEKLWEISKPYAFDSSEEPIRADTVTYTLGKQTYDGVEYDAVTVTLNADTSGMTYPITIDPTTTTIQPDSSGTKTAQIGDTTVASENISPKPNPTYFNLGLFTSNLHARYGLIQFDISSIPAYSTVFSAVMSLYCAYSKSYGKLYVNRILSDWDENTVTYETRPDGIEYPWSSSGPRNSIAVSLVNGKGWSAFDLTSLYSEYVNQSYPNYGIVLTSNSTSDYPNVEANSTIATYNPKLVITYNVPPGVPTITAPTNTSYWNGSHTITWNAASDTDGDALYYRVWLSLDGGATWPYHLTETTATGATSFTVDFTGYPQTANAVLAISAYDGYSWGAWAFSNAFNIHKAPTAPTVTSPNGGNTINTSATVTWNSASDSGIAQSALRYQVELSINGGSTYPYTIASLTAAGATSLAYNFTAIPASTNCKIRVRAYNGYVYGPWDESNAVFTIVHKVQIGTCKIRQSSGLVALPIYDPAIGMNGKNQLRLSTPDGIGCLELGATTDANASPLRVSTSSGIKAVLKQ